MPMKRDAKERVVDWLLVALMVLPFVLSMTLKVLLKPAGEGISITGAQVYFTIPFSSELSSNIPFCSMGIAFDMVNFSSLYITYSFLVDTSVLFSHKNEQVIFLPLIVSELNSKS